MSVNHTNSASSAAAPKQRPSTAKPTNTLPSASGSMISNDINLTIYSEIIENLSDYEQYLRSSTKSAEDKECDLIANAKKGMKENVLLEAQALFSAKNMKVAVTEIQRVYNEEIEKCLRCAIWVFKGRNLNFLT